MLTPRLLVKLESALVRDCTEPDTLSEIELISDSLASVLLTIIELLTSIVEFMSMPVDMAVLSLNRLFNVLGAPFTIPMTAASIALARSDASVRIICEIAESCAISDNSAITNKLDMEVVSETRVDTFVENAVDIVASLFTRDTVASASEVDTD